jgi:hypothetical protein
MSADMAPKGIQIEQNGSQVGIILRSAIGESVERLFSVAETWTICQELGAAARQAQHYASQQQAAQAGVKTGAAPKIGRKPED